VNNGQMRKHWGFGRGFHDWDEFEVDTPAGSCVNITDQAIRWLEHDAPRDKPYFLFLHYYDCHEPYAAPDEFRKAMGATLTGEQTRALAERFHDPESNASPQQIADLRAAYDAEIAWLDEQIGRLLQKIPEDAMVVFFSDHGEAFEEHGWLLHGATLNEEEIRVVLSVRAPKSAKPQAARVTEPAALIDVAPTILAACGGEVSKSFQGVDLLRGAPRHRVIASETKAVLEGRIVYGLTLDDWKATYSLFDGVFALHRLPDETKDLAAQEPKAAGPLFQQLRRWVSSSEQYWLIRAHGRGDFDASIGVTDGVIALFIPVGFDMERDSLEVDADGKSLRFVCYPGGQTKTLYVRLSNPDAALKVDFKINGSQDATQVFVGNARANPAALPAELKLDDALSSPVLDGKFSATSEGFYVTRHRGADASPRAAPVQKLDDETIRQLRSLGYIR
jgi:hypothetical protein